MMTSRTKRKTSSRRIIEVLLSLLFLFLHYCLVEGRQYSNSTNNSHLFVQGGGLRWRNLQVKIEHSKGWFSSLKSVGCNKKKRDQNKILLHSVTGFIPNNHLCGIIGPSGVRLPF